MIRIRYIHISFDIIGKHSLLQAPSDNGGCQKFPIILGECRPMKQGKTVLSEKAVRCCKPGKA